jgi:excisionase family DNA binding protein
MGVKGPDVSGAGEARRGIKSLEPSVGSAVTYLTPVEVSALLQVSTKSVYRWAAQDPTMPTLRLGGTVRFPRERLVRWLRDREQGSPRMRRQVLPASKPA